jgi:hypothetical protein
MVYVKLAQGWTDSTGMDHPAGAMVDVDAATLAGLEATGVVSEAAPLLQSSGGTLSPQPSGGGSSNGGNPEPSGGNPEPSGGNPEPSGGNPEPS